MQFPSYHLDKVVAQILREEDLNQGVNKKVHGGNDEDDKVAYDDGPRLRSAHPLQEVDDRGQEEVHHSKQEGDKVAHDAHQVALVPAEGGGRNVKTTEESSNRPAVKIASDFT